MTKNWDRIVRDLSSPESSDAEDSLNVTSVQKNANRIAQLLHEAIPTLDASKGADGPKGMNPSTLRDELAKTVFAVPPPKKKIAASPKTSHSSSSASASSEDARPGEEGP